MFWINQGSELREDFVRDLRASKVFELRSTDFASSQAAKQINTEIARYTRGGIASVIPEGSLAQSEVLIVSMLDFQSQWVKAFDPDRTLKKGQFRTLAGKTVEAQIMRGVQGLAHYHDQELAVSMVDLPYKSSQLSLVLMLPDRPDGLPALEKRLQATILEQWMSRLDNTPPRQVSLEIPRWSLHEAMPCTKLLKGLGLQSIFDPDKADLTGAFSRPGKYVEAILQNSAFDVNEEGSRASSVTIAKVGSIGVSEPTPFKAVHPFLFGIRDRSTGTFLFWGRLADPSRP